MIKICLDIDEVLADFMGTYIAIFGKNHSNEKITKNVYLLKNNKMFWENLPKLTNIDFEPYIYCTKRINSKIYTKNWLQKNNFPIRPIYQIYHQQGNKATLIKGRCDVLIDDSYDNVMQSIKSGLPALLMSSNYNLNIDTKYRINKLTYKNIERTYNKLF